MERESVTEVLISSQYLPLLTKVLSDYYFLLAEPLKPISLSCFSLSATSRGYKINSAQLSRLLSGEKEAGVEYVIAIAHGLGVAREAAFRARGWLPVLENTEERMEFSREVVEMARELERVPGGMRNMAVDVVQAVVATFLVGTRDL